MIKFKNIIGALALASFAFVPHVLADTPVIDSYLTNGKFVFKSIYDERYAEGSLDEWLYYNTDHKIEIKYNYDEVTHNYTPECNENFTKCVFIYQVEPENPGPMEIKEEKEVEIVWSYDENIKKIIDPYVNMFPENGKTFVLKDMETIRYYEARETYVPKNDEDELNPLIFSSEYRNFVSYKNFVFEPRRGDDNPFAMLRGGTATFEYDGTVYGYVDGVESIVQRVLYVNDSESDVQKALQDRLSKYIPGIKVTKSITKEQTIQKLIDEEKETYNACKQKIAQLVMPVYPVQGDGESFADYQAKMQEYNKKMTEYYQERANLQVNDRYCGAFDRYETVNQLEEDLRDQFQDEVSDEGLMYFYGDAIDDLYTVELPSGLKMDFFVIKDSKKVYSDPIEFVTSDVSTDVTISVDSSLIPLDTLIKVRELTSGEDYDKIVKILNTSNVEMFDLKLFSKSVDKYITKLEDGSFEVKIPLKDEFLDKDLIVYYVDENGKTEAYEVTVDKENKVAIFHTSHFSIYTLAEKPAEEKEVVPNTLDNITKSFMLLFLSGSTLTIVALRRRENN